MTQRTPTRPKNSAQQERRGSVQELLGARARAVDVQPRHPADPGLDAKKFAKDATIRDANLAALRAVTRTARPRSSPPRCRTSRPIEAQFPPGRISRRARQRALSLGLAAAGELADRKIMFCSYPITPLRHCCTRFRDTAISARHVPAEDEIEAVCAAIGASFGGAIGVTSSSGPGIALKTEAIGLAIYPASVS